MNLVGPSRRLLGLAVSAVCCAALLIVGAGTLPDGTPATPQLVETADVSQFDAGNIISDDVFFDATSMDAAAVAAFINAKGASCRTGSDGTPCLKDFVQDTYTRNADSLCRGTYTGAARESAATILTKVARACGVNPQVLLVLIQKEQSLVTNDGSTLWANRYKSAAGMGCPDTAACDAAYYGFFNQVYGAARQFQRYAANPTGYAHVAGRTNFVRYSPKAECGGSQVYIANQATAGLYNYTPYQPTAAALAAGYKAANDTCAAYGNRNFYLYFNDWFGSSTVPYVSGGIAATWNALGGAGGVLGQPVTRMVCGLEQGGCAQHFQGGSVYWTEATGARAVLGPVRDLWAARGWQSGSLGYPTMDTVCGQRDGGCAQHFQGGSVYWSPATGARATSGAVRSAWAARGWQDGVLGYPVTDLVCGLRQGGCAQHFQGGSLYWTAPTGAQLTAGVVRQTWADSGWQDGPVGYPTAEVVCGLTGGGCRQDFQFGSVTWSPATGGRVVSGGIGGLWAAGGGQAGSLGYPTGAMVCGLNRSGCSQQFQGGVVTWSPQSGTAAMSGGILAAWAASGHDRSSFGYPTGAMTCGHSGGGCTQPFQYAQLTWSPATGTRALSGGIAALWVSTGGADGPLGYPTMDMVCGLRGGGCAQHMTGASAYWSPTTGVWASWGPVRDAWAATGWENGYLGYPTTSTTCGLRDDGCTQRFAAGEVAWSAATGAHAVSGGFGATWVNEGRADGPLGYPTSDMACTSAGCTQQFQGGTLSWDSRTHVITRR
ncbi:LGFP repeat-containing protein [Geodermatophilus sp. SYSU D00696]